MALPGQEFFSIDELSARWLVPPHQIAQWAAVGRLQMVTSIPPSEVRGGQIAGLVFVAVADLLPMFRRDRSGPTAMRLWRVKRPEDSDWMRITDPADGVEVAAADLLLERVEAARFENEHEIFGRPHGGGKFETKYDWDAFWRAVVIRVHAKGVHETLKEFVDELEGWFMTRSPTGDCPSDSVIRKRLSPLWRALRQED